MERIDLNIFYPRQYGGQSSSEVPAAGVDAAANQVAVPVSTGPVTFTLPVDELAGAIATALGSVRVYVLESDITRAQESVRTLVQQSKF